MIQQGQPGGRRIYAHAFIAYDLKTGGDTRDVPVVLRRSLTVKGRVIGPDGQPVQDARMVSRFILMPSGVPWRSWQGEYQGHVRNGRFELHGLATDVRGPRLLSRTEAKAGYHGESLGQVGIAADRSLSASSPAARPGRGSSTPRESRSRGIATRISSR